MYSKQQLTLDQAKRRGDRLEDAEEPAADKRPYIWLAALDTSSA